MHGCRYKTKPGVSSSVMSEKTAILSVKRFVHSVCHQQRDKKKKLTHLQRQKVRSVLLTNEIGIKTWELCKSIF